MSAARLLALAARDFAEAELNALPPDALAMCLRPGLGGAWTEVRGGREVVIFGYPANAESRWFRHSAPRDARHTAVSLAIERIVYARGIAIVAVLDTECSAAAHRGAAVHGGAVRVEQRPDSMTREQFLGAMAERRR